MKQIGYKQVFYSSLFAQFECFVSAYSRIDKFTKVTKPLVRKWNGITIDANRKEPDVFESIKEALKNEKAFTEIELNVAIQ